VAIAGLLDDQFGAVCLGHAAHQTHHLRESPGMEDGKAMEHTASRVARDDRGVIVPEVMGAVARFGTNCGIHLTKPSLGSPETLMRPSGFRRKASRV
jgi:hypothetical protein